MVDGLFQLSFLEAKRRLGFNKKESYTYNCDEIEKERDWRTCQSRRRRLRSEKLHIIVTGRFHDINMKKIWSREERLVLD